MFFPFWTIMLYLCQTVCSKEQSMQMLHGLILALVGVLSLFTAEAAETVWEVRANTMDDADVRTEGRCLYA